MIQEIKNVKFKRALVPSDAVDLTCNTIELSMQARLFSV